MKRQKLLKRLLLKELIRKEKRKRKIQKITGGITELVDPTKKKSPDKILKLVCIGLSLFTLYNMYFSYKFIWYVLTDFSIYDLSILIIFFEYAYIIATIALLWLRNKVG